MEGGQGVVRQVRRVQTGELGALKVFKGKATENLKRSRFVGESATLANLDVPGIPRLIAKSDDDKTSDIPWFISEWIDGTAFDNLTLPLAADDALETTIELAQIVSSCHMAGVIHRDIKPANIIEKKSGEVFLVDFGIAYEAERDLKDLTKPKERMANAFLALPELAAGSVDKRNETSDVTMVVAILFYLATGGRPRQLRDGENAGPHRRTQLHEGLVNSDKFDLLMRVWDIGFQQQVSQRFEGAQDLLAFLQAEDGVPIVGDANESLGRLSARLAATPGAEDGASMARLKESLTEFVQGVGATVRPHGFNIQQSAQNNENDNDTTFVRTVRLMKDNRMGPACSIYCHVTNGRVRVSFGFGEVEAASAGESIIDRSLSDSEGIQAQLMTYTDLFVQRACTAWEFELP